MPDSKSSYPSTHKFATTLPHAGASASNNLEPKDLFLGEIFANLRFVLFGSHRCAFNVHFATMLFAWLWSIPSDFSMTLIRGIFLAEQSFPPL